MVYKSENAMKTSKKILIFVISTIVFGMYNVLDDRFWNRKI